MSEMAPEPHSECRCGRPTRDGAWTCDTCGDQFTHALNECPWVDTELVTTISGQRGVDYRSSGGTRTKARVNLIDDMAKILDTGDANHVTTPINIRASNAATHLRATLATWVRYCLDHNVRHQSPKLGIPTDTITDMSRWLLWRVDGLTFTDGAGDAVEQITGAVSRAKRVIDRPADKWYAGPCDNEECRADIYARALVGVVKCGECSRQYDIAERRAWLLASAEDRLHNAVDIARAVSWLGATPLTPERVRQWASRGRLLAKGHDGKSPLYRVGDAIDLLADTTKVG